MKGFVTFVSIFALILPCLCTRLNATNGIYNVMQYGARGDGKSDDSKVHVSMSFFFII